MSGNRFGRFSTGGVTLSADFRGKGASPTNHCWRWSSRVIAVSQYTRVTDGRTELRQHGKNEIEDKLVAIFSLGRSRLRETKVINKLKISIRFAQLSLA